MTAVERCELQGVVRWSCASIVTSAAKSDAYAYHAQQQLTSCEGQERVILQMKQ